MSHIPDIFFQTTTGYFRRTSAGVFVATSPIIVKLERPMGASRKYGVKQMAVYLIYN